MVVVNGFERGLRGLCLDLERGLRKGLRSEEQQRPRDEVVVVAVVVVVVVVRKRVDEAKVLSIVVDDVCRV
jgi:hypothetical protein